MRWVLLVVLLVVGTARPAAATISVNGSADGGSIHVPQSSMTSLSFNEGGGSPEIVTVVTLTGMAGDCAASFSLAVPFTVSNTSGGMSNMTFQPNKPNTTYNCTVTLLNGSTTIGSFTATGVGVGPVVVDSPSSLAFGSLRVNDTAQTLFTKTLNVNIVNNGNGDLQITATSLSGSGDFAITSGSGSSTVTPANMRTLGITYNPSTLGAASGATLVVTARDPVSAKDYSQTISLTGSGTGAVVTVTPAGALDYGIVGVGGSGMTSHVTIANTATLATRGPLTVTSANITGGGNWFSFGQNGAFNCSGQTCNTIGLAITNTSKDIDIICNPTPATATGTQNATVTIASDTDAGGDSVATLSCTAGHATLGFSTTTLTFGDQRVNTSSAPMTMTITNTGNLAGTFTAVRTGDTEFTTPCTGGGTVPAGGGMTTCNFTFSPTALGNGKTASFTFSTNDVDNGSVIVSATGNGVYPSLVVPANLAFGSVDIGTSSPVVTLTVTNTGTQTLNISSAALDVNPSNTYTIVTGTTGAQQVAPGGSVSWMLTCTPTAQGAQNGDFKLTSDAFTSPNPSVPLSCTGQRGILTGNPNPVDFGPVIVSSINSKPLTLANGGNLDVMVTAADLSATNKGYAIHGGFSPFTITAGGTHPLQIDFDPLATTDGGTVTLTFTASWTGNSTHAITTPVTLNGSALAAAVTLSPSPVDFGSIRFDTPATLSLCILNGSMASVKLISMSITPDSGTMSNELTLGGPLKLAPSCTAATTGTYTLGGSLPVGQAVIAPITATPAARLGTLGADLAVTTDIPVNPTIHDHLTATSTSGMVDISPTSLDFGPVDIDAGPVTKMVTVTNTGGAAFDISNWSQTSSNPSLAITLPPGSTTLPPAGSVEVMVIYDPSAVTASTGTITFTLAHVLGGPAMGTVMITGRGADRTFTVSPDAQGVTFPDTFVHPGSKAPHAMVTVTNTGEAPLHVTAVMASDPSFTVADGATTVTIAGSAAHAFDVAFAPAMTGAFTGTLTFTNDDDQRLMAMIPIRGNGLARDVTATTVVDVGYVAVGASLALPDAVIVQNLDPDHAFQIASVTTNDDAFAVDDAVGPLAAGASRALTVRFTPAASGDITAVATLFLDENPDPQSQVVLRGHAVDVEVTGGGGCDAGRGGGSGLLGGALLGAAAWFARRRRALAVAPIILAAGSARADEIAVGAFAPTPTTDAAHVAVQVESPDVGRPGDVAACAVASYATDLLVIKEASGGQPVADDRAIARRTGIVFGVAAAIVDGLEVALTVPIYAQSGDATTPDGLRIAPASGTSLGDIALHAKLRLYRHDALALGAALHLTMPTATDDQYLGNDTPSARLLGLARWQPHPRIALAAELGAVLRATATDRDAAFVGQGSGLVWGASATAILHPRLALAAELFGEHLAHGDTGAEMTSVSPVEWLAGLTVHATPELSATIAGGAGLVRGVGSPGMRGVVSISFTPMAGSR